MTDLGFHCHRLSHLEERILANDLSRGEFYNLPAEEVVPLKRQILSHSLSVSIHTPLIKTDWYPDPPTWSFLCDLDKENRSLTLKLITGTMEQAEDFGAEYVVVHFPTQSSDLLGEDMARLEDVAWWSCDRLAELSTKHQIPIHMEGVGASPLLSLDFLSRVFAEFSPLRYCFDTGHMHLAALSAGFDLYAFARGVAPYLGSVHLWNTRGSDDYHSFRHIPVHPGQSPDEGWVDIAQVLTALEPGKAGHPIILESAPRYPEALGSYDYRDGVRWVKELLKTSS